MYIVMNYQSELDSWCAAVPGLRKNGEGWWVAAGDTEISFPVESHASLAELEAQSYWFQHRNHVIASVVTQLPPSGPILDVGGGNGFVSLGLKEAGFPSFVIEPGETAVRICRERGVPVVQAAFQDIDLADDTADAIGMFDVLEHIGPDDEVLASLHRVLKPEGMLYLTVPAYGWLWSHEDVAAGHFRRYTLTRLVSQLGRAGFRVEFGSYMFAALVLPLFLLRSIPTRLGLRTEASHTQTTREHTLPENAVGRALKWSFAREQARIARGRPVASGTSCLIATRAIKQS